MIRKNNKGFSLVELIVVLAIMAVMIGIGGFTLSLMIGGEAKQAATKLNAQLNDVKTGAMSRYDEYMIVSYVDVASYADKKTAAADGVPESGFYVDKHMATIRDTSSIRQDITADTEKARIGSATVKMTVVTSGGSYVLTSPKISGDVDAVRIGYDRATGKLSDVYVGTASDLTTGGTNAGQIQEITFEGGSKTYTITFVSETGKHKLG